jgi:hypothetical protein
MLQSCRRQLLGIQPVERRGDQGTPGFQVMLHTVGRLQENLRWVHHVLVLRKEELEKQGQPADQSRADRRNCCPLDVWQEQLKSGPQVERVE